MISLERMWMNIQEELFILDKDLYVILILAHIILMQYIFSIKKSLPILTNTNNETIFTRCYGDKANYTLHFDRPLERDEEINFSLVPNPNSARLINISQLERGGNTFTLENLPIGDYKLRIKGRNEGDSYSKYGNEDFKFSIKNPSRVVFHTIGTAPSCANANNGEIKILAFGGTNQKL